MALSLVNWLLCWFVN